MADLYFISWLKQTKLSVWYKKAVCSEIEDQNPDELDTRGPSGFNSGELDTRGPRCGSNPGELDRRGPSGA